VKLVRLDEVVMKAPLILSLVVLVTLPVSLSLKPFICAGGGFMPLDHTSVQMVTPISSPVGTLIGGEDVDVELKFSLETAFAAAAGTYTGTVIFTIMEGP
jgi:hypothetical protein